MLEKTYWFSATIQQGRMHKIYATIDKNENICAVKDDAYKAFLMLRHELYHYVISHDMGDIRIAPPSLFDKPSQADCLICLIDVDVGEYMRKHKKFRRKSRWISTITGERQWTYDLISTYRKQYVYPVRISKEAEGYQIIFLDFHHELIIDETEFGALALGRARLYKQIQFWKQEKIDMPVATSPFNHTIKENERITLVDVEVRSYKKYMK